mgnify:CR=1 FL=1
MSLFRRMKLKNQIVWLLASVILMLNLLLLVYYSYSRSILTERSRLHAIDTITQVEKSIHAVIEQEKNIGSQIAFNQYVQQFVKLDGGDVAQMLDLYNYISQMVSNAVMSNEDILSVQLISGDGERVSPITGDLPSEVTGEIRAIDFRMLPKGDMYCLSFQTYRHNRLPVYGILYPILDLYPNSAASGEKIGYVAMVCSMKNLDKMIVRSKLAPNANVFVMDGTGTILLSTDKSMNGLSFAETPLVGLPLTNLNPQARYDYDGRKSIARSETVSVTNWNIIHVVPISDLLTGLNGLNGLTAMMIAAFSLLLILGGWMIIQNITLPINTIVEKLDKVGNTNFAYRLDVHHENEVGMLAKDINAMLDKLEEMTRRIFESQRNLYEVELSRKQTQLNALQSQINPHFLYNTLECMKSIGLVYEVPQIVTMAVAMSDIFRYSIKGSSYVTIRDELTCIRNYFKIISIRFMDRIKLFVEIDDNLLDHGMLRMLLQPLVENAVYHGLEKRYGEGLVSIRFQIRDEKLLVELSDNGRGMDGQTLRNLRASL